MAFAIGMAAAWLWLRRMPDQAQPVVINETAVASVPTLNPQLVAEGASVYAANCARCHGINLEGVPNWKKSLPDGSLPPPPHDSSGHTWHHPDSVLMQIITQGGDPAFNSKMPAFKGILREDEMKAALTFIKSKWGRDQSEYQWWITATGQ